MTFHIIGDKRKSRFDPDLADRVNKRVEEEERRELLEQKLREVRGETEPEVSPAVEPEAAAPSGTGIQIYNRIEKPSYALGVDALRKLGLEPFSFKDNLQARLEQPDLYDTWLDSRCGIAYKAGTTKIKIIPDCKELKDISVNFKAAFLSVPYNSLSRIELDTSQGKWNTPLTPAEIVVHPGWLAAVEGDKDFLEKYVRETFAAYAQRYQQAEKLMCFYVLNSPAEDQLRALFVYDLDYRSGAIGSNNLNIYGSFLRRVAPVVR